MTSIWNGDPNAIVNADNTYKSQRFVATEGQTVFTLTNFVYTPGTDSLLVYVSGVDQYKDIHYSETGPTVVTFLQALKADDEVVIRGLVGSIASQTAAESAEQAAQSAADAHQAYLDTLGLTPASLPLPIDKGGSGKITRVAALQAFDSPPQERNSNTMLVAGDHGSVIKYTGGAFTQTIDSVSNLGAAWKCVIHNESGGDILLDPNAFEQINLKNTRMMYPKEAILLYVNKDVTGLSCIVLNCFEKVFTTSENYYTPTGYSSFVGEAWSGASSGQRTNNAAVLSYGGGGAGYIDFDIPTSKFADIEFITVGAGGASVSGVAVGNLGGTTSIGSILSVYAGQTFNYGGSVSSGLTAATTSNNLPPVAYEGGKVTNPGANDLGIDAIKGGAASTSMGSSTIRSGNSVFGGAAGGSCSPTATVSTGGTSILGGNGGNANSATDGQAGVAPGGGGGATQTGSKSGAGARGEVRIRGRI